MAFKFEKLRVWQIALDFGEKVYQVSLQFPAEEKFNLTSQIRRAADSVVLNISEGSVGQTNLEFSRFLGYAMRSLAEVVTCLYKAKFRNYLHPEAFEILYNDAFQLMNQLSALRNTLRKTK